MNDKTMKHKDKTMRHQRALKNDKKNEVFITRVLRFFPKRPLLKKKNDSFYIRVV